MTSTLRRLQEEAYTKYYKETKEGDATTSRNDDADKEFYKAQRKFHGSVNKIAKDIERVLTSLYVCTWTYA